MDNYEIQEYCKDIPGFKGVFPCNDPMFSSHALPNECGIVNFETYEAGGTHWVCYSVKNNMNYYFDSFGGMPDTLLENYLRRTGDLIYNTSQFQAFDSQACGYFCIYVLQQLVKRDFVDIMLDFDFEHDENLLRKYFGTQVVTA